MSPSRRRVPEILAIAAVSFSGFGFAQDLAAPAELGELQIEPAATPVADPKRAPVFTGRPADSAHG